MSQTDDLFELVRGLSSTEKRYITQYCSAFRDDAIYLKLFEDLCQESDYDESLFREKHGDKPYIQRFSAVKNQLKNRILEALKELSRKERGIEYQVMEMIGKADILVTREFRDEALQLLEKADKLATTYELFEYRVTILKKQRDLIINSRAGHSGIIEEKYATLSSVIGQLGIRQQYLELKDKFYLLARKSAVHVDPKMIGQLEEWIHHPLLQAETEPQDFDAKNYFFAAHVLFHQLTGDLMNSWAWQRKAVDHWMKHPEIRKDRPGLFCNLLNNYLQVTNELDLDDDFLKYLDILRAIKASKHESLNLQLNILINELHFQIRTGNWMGALRSRDEFDGIDDAHLPQSRHFAFNFLLSCLGFILDDFDEAKRRMESIKRLRAFESRKDLHFFAYMMGIFISHETDGEFDKELRAVKRQIGKKNEIWKWQSILMELFSKLLSASPHDQKNLYAEALAHLREVQQNSFEQSSAGFWLALKWLESKAHQIPLRDWIGKRE
ncbi:MAG: hypothetical protein H6581_21355 [Bacteroidia bacterium]|nr:hypothetical protein [Bacteroidia bacterium]